MTGIASRTTRTEALAKTLYTPVFYATPESSASTSTGRTGLTGHLEVYLDQLSRKHVALSQIVQEVPSSRSASPEHAEWADPVGKARIEALRKRVTAAFEYASGDTADGKWSAVVQLLRLNVARNGPRWVGSTTEGKKIESTCGWINADTEAEWKEWEKKWRAEVRVKEKVENWQKKVGTPLTETAAVVSLSEGSKSLKRATTTNEHVPSVVSGTTKVTRATTTLATIGRDPRAPPALGFLVIKRSSLTVIGKPKPPGKFPTAEPVAGPSKPNSTDGQRRANTARPVSPPIDSSSSQERPQRRAIIDISETSFLPPSFPSQLDTSTPKTSDKRRKPSPIAAVPPSSPLSSPPNTRVYGRQRSNLDTSSSSLPDPPTTPTRYPGPLSPATRQKNGEKRPRSVTPDQAVKRARAMPALPNSHESMPCSTSPSLPFAGGAPANPPPTTPERKNLPTLTELLASSKQRNKTSPRKAKKVKPDTMPSELLQTETELVIHKEVMVEKEPTKVKDPNPPSPIVYAGSYLTETSTYALGLGIGMDTNMDMSYDMASPAKSLSSLAASDSGSDEEDATNGLDIDLEGFNPPFVSTQAGRTGAAKEAGGFGWMGYNSQFDVDGRVDLVSKFMEKDVDYDGWLRDPSPEPDNVGSSQ